MQPIILEVKEREVKLSKGKLNNLRREGILPGVIYGQTLEPIAFTVPKRELIKIIGEHGINAILGVKVGDDKPVQTMIKDIQKHPVTGNYWHLDLARISLTEAVRATVPIVFEGEPVGVHNGGFIQYGETHVEVECLPMELPQNISLDISALEIGDKVVVGDLRLSGEITVLGEAEQVIISVVAPSMEEEETEEVADSAETVVTGNQEDEQ